MVFSEFLDPEVGEINRAIVVLETDGTRGGHFREESVVDDHLAVEGDAEAVSFQRDHGAVPFTLRFVGLDFWRHARAHLARHRRVFTISVNFAGPHWPVPQVDLAFRVAAQINPAVEVFDFGCSGFRAIGHDEGMGFEWPATAPAPIADHREVAVGFLGPQVVGGACFAIMFEDALHGFPVCWLGGVFPASEGGAVEDFGKPGRLDPYVIGDGWEFGDMDFAERDAIAVTKPCDVTGAALDALVVWMRSAHVVEVGAQDDFAVEFHFEARAHDGDAFLIPLADGFEKPLFGGSHGVKTSMILIVFQILVFGIRAVENLDFHAFIGSISRSRIMNAQSVVGSGGELKIEIEHEVGKRLLGDEVAALWRANDGAVLDKIALAFPSAQILAVKQRTHGHRLLGDAGKSAIQRGEWYDG